MIENKFAIDPCPYLKIGDRIIIHKGPLRGFEEYTLEKRNRNTTLVGSVDAIFSSVKCVVNVDFVEAS